MRHLAFGLGSEPDSSDKGSKDDKRRFYGQVTALATVTASAMIAQQVAGKAIRDALFLSTFYVKSLPAMMAGGAIASPGGGGGCTTGRNGRFDPTLAGLALSAFAVAAWRRRRTPSKAKQ